MGIAISYYCTPTSYSCNWCLGFLQDHPNFSPKSLFGMWNDFISRYGDSWKAVLADEDAQRTPRSALIEGKQTEAASRPSHPSLHHEASINAPLTSGWDHPDVNRRTASCCKLTWLVFKRSFIQQTREKLKLLMDNLLVFVAALFLAAVYEGDPILKPPQPAQVSPQGALMDFLPARQPFP